MAKFNLDNYETVEERLKKFWKDNPNGRVETEVVHITDDGKCVTIKSAIYKDINDTHPVATGIAQETKGQGGFANADAWMENCETSSLGRSLSNWMYQGANKPRPSKEEMSKVGNQDKVQVTKVDNRKKENKPSDESLSSLEEAKAKFDEDIGVNKEVSSNNASQIAKLIAGWGLPKATEDEVKKKSFNEFIGAGHSKDVESWDNDTIGAYLDLFESIANEQPKPSDVKIVEDVFGEVKDLTKACPECGATEWIEDNRQKKQDDPDKYGKIPSWSCNKYPAGGKHGCGWTGWGDTDCPTEWL
jgi:hypothetical protein